MRFLWSICVACALAGPAFAEGPISTSEFDVSKLAASLPDRTLKALEKGPDYFVEEVAGLILGYGGDEGIDRKGLETAIQHGWAKARARARSDLGEADLNADGAITAGEAKIVGRTMSGWSRGRLMLRFRAADLDLNGTVSDRELESFAEVRALKALPNSQADAWRDLMLFDLNENGLLALEEVLLAVKAFKGEV